MSVILYFTKLLIDRYSCFVFWCVRYSHVSDSINVSNGVRLGGILFHYLFSVYVDGLSTDDLVVFCLSNRCLSTRGLQTLLTIFYQYGFSHDIKYN